MTGIWCKSLTVWMVLVITCSSVHAQTTAVFTNKDRLFRTAMQSYDMGMYAQAAKEFEEYMEIQRAVEEDESDLALWQADLYHSLSLLYNHHPDAEVLLVEYIEHHEPSAMSQRASSALADYFFDAKAYKKALLYYADVQTDNLSQHEIAQNRFRQGYSYFNTREFKSAILYFNQVPANSNQHHEDATYYKGISYYFLGNYAEASMAFDQIERSTKYAYDIPYYNAVILTENEEWDKIPAYLKSRINDAKIKNKKELNLILGQSYYKNENYEEALVYLEKYNELSKKMRSDEFYLLGYTHYKTKNYDTAAEYLVQISNQQDALGQNANFYLAESYLQLGNKKNARIAFSRASKVDFDKRIKDEALYNYALLSMDQQDDRASIDALIKIKHDSPNYNRAQSFLAEIFLNTRDYKRAIEILSSLDRNSNSLKKSYQMVTYNYAIQNTDDGKLGIARKYFNVSLKENVLPSYTSAATFWLGYIDHKEEKLDHSTRQLKKYLTMHLSNSPTKEASKEMANYLIGYNYFEIRKYKSASQHFSEGSKGELPVAIKSDNYLRMADCQFSLNDYHTAMIHYDRAEDISRNNSDYIMFQKGLLYGLMNHTDKKINTLENLILKMPKSSFASRALYEKGITELNEDKRIKAIESFNQLISDYPTSAFVNKSNLKLGLIYYNHGESQRALTKYKNVLSNNPNKNESNEAIIAVEEIYIEDLKNPNGYAVFLNDFPSYKIGNSRRDSLNYRVAYKYYEEAKYAEAISAFDNYINSFAGGIQSIDAYYYRGECKSLTDQYHKAYLDYTYIISKGSSDHYQTSLYKAAIIAYTHDQDYQNAYDHYNDLAQLSNTEDRQQVIHVGAMKSAIKINDQVATEKYAQLLLENPLSTEYEKGLAHYYIATAAHQNNDYANALINFNKASKFLNNELAAESNFRIGQIYFIRNQYDLSEIYAESAVKKNSNYPYWVAKNLLLLSDVLFIKGDFFNAHAALEAVIENYNSDFEILASAKEKLKRVKNREIQNTRVEQNSQKENIQFQKNEQK